jgi:hypothetical protein
MIAGEGVLHGISDAIGDMTARVAMKTSPRSSIHAVWRHVNTQLERTCINDIPYLGTQGGLASTVSRVWELCRHADWETVDARSHSLPPSPSPLPVRSVINRKRMVFLCSLAYTCVHTQPSALSSPSGAAWASQFEALPYLPPSRRLWMGPQFTFKVGSLVNVTCSLPTL